MRSIESNMTPVIAPFSNEETIPGQPVVGGIFLRDLCGALPPGTIHCFAVPTRLMDRAQLKDCPEVTDFVERRYETAFRPVRGKLGEFIALVARSVKQPRHLRTIVDRAVQCGRSHRVQMVWAVLDCPTVIQTARLVASRLGVPLIVLVWDAPELLSHQLQHDRWFSRELLRCFQVVMKSSIRCAVVGETMKAAYDDAYGQDCIIVRHGLEPRAVQSCQGEQRDREQTIIGYAGSISAPETFRGFIRALDASGWKVDGRDVILRLAGSRLLLDASTPQRIEYFGRRSVCDTAEMLADCDVLYLPQPFSNELRPLASLSFPTKLSTYLAAGRPVLLHAPEHGSVVPFFKKYSCGTWCNSLQENEIASSLRKLTNDSVRYCSAVQAVQAAVQDELNSEVFHRRFRRFLLGDQNSRERGDP